MMIPSPWNEIRKRLAPPRGRVFLATILSMLVICASPSFAAEASAIPGVLSKKLAEVKLFGGLTDAERSLLESVATLRRGKAAERIIEQGKVSGMMVIVMEGRTEIRVNDTLIASLSGQTLVGEIGFLDGLPASATVILAEDADLIELNNAALTALMERQPRLGYVLMREIARIEARRLRDAHPK